MFYDKIYLLESMRNCEVNIIVRMVQNTLTDMMVKYSVQEVAMMSTISCEMTP